MGFLEDKWQEAFGSLILCIAMGIALLLVPNNDWLRFYVMLLSMFVIAYLIGLLKGGVRDVSWRDAPFIILALLWAPLAWVGAFVMIGGGIFLVLGGLAADSELLKNGMLIFLGGLSPYAAKWIASVAFKYAKEWIRRHQMKKRSVAVKASSAKGSQSPEKAISHT
jgi:hypothetical protein